MSIKILTNKRDLNLGFKSVACTYNTYMVAFENTLKALFEKYFFLIAICFIDFFLLPLSLV